MNASLRRTLALVVAGLIVWGGWYGWTSWKTSQTINALKVLLKDYFRKLGNSIPPRYLWKPLWELYRTDTSVLLARCKVSQQNVSTEDYFA